MNVLSKAVSFAIFITFLVFLSYFVSGFYYGQDAYTYHIPVIRYYCENGVLPKHVPYSLYYGEMLKPIFIYVLLGSMCSIFGEWIIYAVPFLFLFLTLFITFRLCEAFKINLLIPFSLFLIEQFFLKLHVWIYQEFALITLSTMFFTVLVVSERVKRKEHKMLLYVVLGTLSYLLVNAKMIGIIFPVFLLIYFVVESKKHKNNLLSLVLLFSSFPGLFEIVKLGAKGLLFSQFSVLRSISYGTMNYYTLLEPFAFHVALTTAVFFSVLRFFMRNEKNNIYGYFLFFVFATLFATFDPRHFSYLIPFSVFIASVNVNAVRKKERKKETEKAIKLFAIYSLWMFAYFSIIKSAFIVNYFYGVHLDKTIEYVKMKNYTLVSVDTDFGFAMNGINVVHVNSSSCDIGADVYVDSPFEFPWEKNVTKCLIKKGFKITKVFKNGVANYTVWEKR